MGIFNKKQKISGGNSFETDIALQTATNIAVENLLSQTDNNTFALTVTNKVNDKVIQPYYLFLQQSYYFTNIIEWEQNEHDRILKNVVLGAWMFGKAGIYKIGEKFVPIYINKLERNIYGEITKIQYCSLFLMLDNTSPEIPQNMKWIETKEIDKIAIFSWGMNEISAWLMIYPFVKYQHELLVMCIVSGYSYNKKWIYNVRTGNINTAELDSWLNPYNFMIINKGGNELTNKFKFVDMGGSGAVTPIEFIEFYNSVVKSYYEILGRRYNTEKKNSNNVAGEIDLAESQFNHFETEIKTCFRMFIQDCKKLGLEIKEIEKESDTNDVNEFNTNNEKRE